MQSNETYCIYQTKMIMHFTCQRSDAKFTVREAGLRAHCITLLYFPQQVSHVNFVRIVTRNVLCSHRSSVIWIVVGVTVAVTAAECATLMWRWQCQRQSGRPRGDNTISLTATTTSVGSVYRHCCNYSETIRVHQTLIVCWRPLWVRLEPKNRKSK